MTNRDLEEYSDQPLSPMENQKARRMLAEHDRAHWLWSFLLKCVIVAGSLAGAAAAIKTWLSTWVVFK